MNTNKENEPKSEIYTLLATGCETDPHLREIYATGYTKAEEDVVGNKIRLIDMGKKYVKEICLYEYYSVIRSLTYKRGVSDILEGAHTWIAESDGSADRFRALIEPCC